MSKFTEICAAFLGAGFGCGVATYLLEDRLKYAYPDEERKRDDMRYKQIYRYKMEKSTDPQERQKWRNRYNSIVID